MWPFTSSSSNSSSSQTVASDLNPPAGPSTQTSPTIPIPPTPQTQGRLNIPCGNSPISQREVGVEGDTLTGDKWTDYKAAFEVRALALSLHYLPLLRLQLNTTCGRLTIREYQLKMISQISEKHPVQDLVCYMV